MREIELKNFECTICGGKLIADGTDRYRCQSCGKEYLMTETEREEVSHSLALLQMANVERESANFAKAENLYRNIVKDNLDEKWLADAYWGLFLCEQHCMFETDENGNQFPSFYDISPVAIDASEALANAISSALSQGDSKKANIFKELSVIMKQSKVNYQRIKQTEEPYDIFICFKKSKMDGSGANTAEYRLAYQLYNQLCREYRVFFSEESLKNIVVRQYEPNIYHALYTAKVMLVLCSHTPYLNSQWVKNEWSRYIEMSKTSSEAKTVIPIFYHDYKVENLPVELKKYQGIREDINLMSTLNETVRNIIKPVDKEAELNARFEELNRRFDEKVAVAGGTGVNIDKLRHSARNLYANGNFRQAQQKYLSILDVLPDDYSCLYMVALCSYQDERTTKNFDNLLVAAGKFIARWLGDQNRVQSDLQFVLESLQKIFFASASYLNDHNLKNYQYIANQIFTSYIGDKANQKTFAGFFAYDTIFDRGTYDGYKQYARACKRYIEAMDLYQSGDFVKAYDILKSLEDVPNLIVREFFVKCCRASYAERLRIAKELYEGKQFTASKARYNQMLDDALMPEAAEDIKKRITLCDYGLCEIEYVKACAMINSGKKMLDELEYGNAFSQFVQAIAKFDELINGTDAYAPPEGGYKQSAKWRDVCESWKCEVEYRKGNDLLKQGGDKLSVGEMESAYSLFNDAMTAFAKIFKTDLGQSFGICVPANGYKDSIKKYNDCNIRKLEIIYRLGLEYYNREMNTKISYKIWKKDRDIGRNSAYAVLIFRKLSGAGDIPEEKNCEEVIKNDSSLRYRDISTYDVTNLRRECAFWVNDKYLFVPENGYKNSKEILENQCVVAVRHHSELKKLCDKYQTWDWDKGWTTLAAVAISVLTLIFFILCLPSVRQTINTHALLIVGNILSLGIIIGIGILIYLFVGDHGNLRMCFWALFPESILFIVTWALATYMGA